MATLAGDNLNPRWGCRQRLPGQTELHKFFSATIFSALIFACAVLFLQETVMAQSSVAAPKTAETLTSAQLNDSMKKLQTELLAKYGEAQKPRISTGLHQVMEFWRPEDGDAAAFESFVIPLTLPATRNARWSDVRALPAPARTTRRPHARDFPRVCDSTRP
jgi:hypothetical protein